MNDRLQAIEEMKCFAFRIAQRRWKISARRCAELFKCYNIYGFIQECFDILQLSSYDCVVNDIERILADNGVSVFQCDDEAKPRGKKGGSV